MKLDDHWKGAVPEVDEWWTGDANSPIVLLQNDQEEVERNPIYNILGKITGIEQPEKSSTYFRNPYDQTLTAETCLEEHLPSGAFTLQTCSRAQHTPVKSRNTDSELLM